MHEATRVARGLSPLPEADWLRLLFAHFHDAIPGSSISQVYAELNPELAAVGDRAYASALETMEIEPVASGAATVAFNALPFDRIATVRHNGASVQVRLPALGSAAIDPHCDVTGPILEASPAVLRHDRLTARFDASGQLWELIVDGRALELDGSPRFVLSPDKPVAFDAWDIDHHAARVGQPVAEKMELRLVEHSRARAVLESAPVPLGDSSELRLRYILDAGCTHLRVEPTVEWQQSHQLLRYVVPTRYLGRSARMGCPFGAIERPQLAGTEADEAMWEVPGSRWAAVQHDGGSGGLAILAESKLGYAAREGTLSLSLLRAPKWPDATADLGVHTMPFALGALQLETTDNHLSTSMSADALFSPPLLHRGAPLPGRFRWQHLGSLNASWCGPSVAETGGYFVRLHETAGRPGTARLQLADAAAAELVDFREQPLAELDQDGEGVIGIPYRPWQILTLRILPTNH